ncbi:hypothetical protein OG609_28180 [Streptomyces sp. NBC_01224]|nr:hypothetical protein OG609_28180 [Streptomyces sp. NBC_01224]
MSDSLDTPGARAPTALQRLATFAHGNAHQQSLKKPASWAARA